MRLKYEPASEPLHVSARTWLDWYSIRNTPLLGGEERAREEGEEKGKKEGEEEGRAEAHRAEGGGKAAAGEKNATKGETGGEEAHGAVEARGGVQSLAGVRRAVKVCGSALEVQVAGAGDDPEQLLRRNVKRFRGGLVCKAHRLLYHSTLGLRVIKKKK